MNEANNQASPNVEEMESCLRVLRWLRDGNVGLDESWTLPLTHVAGCVRGCIEIAKAERAGGREPAVSKTPEPSTLASATCSAAAVETEKSYMEKVGRCNVTHPKLGWQCGMPRGHKGKHTLLIPTNAPWLLTQTSESRPDERTDCQP